MGLPEVFLAVSVGSTLMQGFAANKAAGDEADRLGDQADLARSENEAEAERQYQEDEKFRARQKLAYLKGGVTLEGTPLDILRYEKSEAEKYREATIQRGIAQQSIGRQKAAAVKTAGRAKLFGSFAKAAGASSGFFS